MTLQQAKEAVLQAISNLYDQREAGNIASMVIEKISGKSKMDQFLNKEEVLNNDATMQLNDCMRALSVGTPVQYVLGEAWFMGMVFRVNKDTLIPRPETEELVEWIINDLKDAPQKKYKVLDIGSGSGCIPISLKKLAPQLTVQSVDISEGAIKTANENAIIADSSVEFIELDFLNENNWNQFGTIDIIVSNPPYIRESEQVSMAVNVVNFEPASALFVPDNDPLLFYRKILHFSEKHLPAGGRIYLEINEALGNETVNLFNTAAAAFETILKKDMQGKDRMIRATKKG